MDIYGVYSRFRNGCRLSLMNMAYCDSIDISEKQEVASTAERVDPARTTLDRMAEMSRSSPTIAITDAEVQNVLDRETGRDRLKAMYSKTDTNGIHAEMMPVVAAVVQGSVIMGFVGWVIGGRLGRERFLEKTKHKVYENKFLAFRSMNDSIFLGGMKHGSKWAAKTGIYCGTFMLVSQSLSFYRNDTQVIDYGLSGALTGALFRFSMGPKGMFAGGVIGSGLGLTIGAIIYGMGSLSSELIQQRHWRRIHDELRDTKERKNMLEHPDLYREDYNAKELQKSFEQY